jgi:hypothetical protein
MCVVKLGNIQYDPGDRLLHDNEVCAPNNNKYKQSGIVRPGLSYVQFCGHICSVVAPIPSHLGEHLLLDKIPATICCTLMKSPVNSWIKQFRSTK